MHFEIHKKSTKAKPIREQDRTCVYDFFLKAYLVCSGVLEYAKENSTEVMIIIIIIKIIIIVTTYIALIQS